MKNKELAFKKFVDNYSNIEFSDKYTKSQLKMLNKLFDTLLLTFPIYDEDYRWTGIKTSLTMKRKNIKEYYSKVDQMMRCWKVTNIKND